ncbi:MAG: hypothetical protein ACUVXA_03870 [Candidatus Jordarchaeum sp.]|uniref:hypothetical protein n=1 Tax=Candidatus Jordarchaeum sp. TaxID=2823881 RepID=UPI00404A9CC6
MAKEMDLEASAQIISLASKYIIISVVAVAFGAVSIVYSVLAYWVYGSFVVSFSIILGFFIGLAFIVIGLFLTFWGLVWMRSEGKRLEKKLAQK